MSLELSAPLRVVIVDDTPDLRDLLRMALERRGEFQVVAEAENGREAIEVVHAQQPELVLLDIAMPVMDGLEALPVIRKVAALATVVMLSGFHESHVLARKAVELGAHGYVSKGERLSLLVGRLRDIVNRATRSAASPAHPRLEPDG